VILTSRTRLLVARGVIAAVTLRVWRRASCFVRAFPISRITSPVAPGSPPSACPLPPCFRQSIVRLLSGSGARWQTPPVTSAPGTTVASVGRSGPRISNRAPAGSTATIHKTATSAPAGAITEPACKALVFPFFLPSDIAPNRGAPRRRPAASDWPPGSSPSACFFGPSLAFRLSFRPEDPQRRVESTPTR